MRANRSDAHLVKEYAAQARVSLRTAQVHRKKGVGEWQAFLTDKLQTSTDAVEPVRRLTIEEEEEKAALRYAKVEEMLQSAMNRKDFAMVSSLLKVAEQSHKLLLQVRSENAEHYLRIGKLIESREVIQWMNNHLVMVKQRIEGLPEVLASRIPIASEDVDVFAVVNHEVVSILRDVAAAAGSVADLGIGSERQV